MEIKTLNRENLEGQRFGRLIALHEIPEAKKGEYRYLVMCQCDCGKITTVRRYKLFSGHTKSCGCLHQEKLKTNGLKHGGNKTTTHYAWMNMKARCRETSRFHEYYFDRGICVCERWQNSFQNFLDDMGECPEGYTLERKNNDGIYESGNCKWATRLEQARNTRKYLNAKNHRHAKDLEVRP